MKVCSRHLAAVPIVRTIIRSDGLMRARRATSRNPCPQSPRVFDRIEAFAYASRSVTYSRSQRDAVHFGVAFKDIAREKNEWRPSVGDYSVVVRYQGEVRYVRVECQLLENANFPGTLVGGVARHERGD